MRNRLPPIYEGFTFSSGYRLLNRIQDALYIYTHHADTVIQCKSDAAASFNSGYIYSYLYSINSFLLTASWEKALTVT